MLSTLLDASGQQRTKAFSSKCMETPLRSTWSRWGDSSSAVTSFMTKSLRKTIKAAMVRTTRGSTRGCPSTSGCDSGTSDGTSGGSPGSGCWATPLSRRPCRRQPEEEATAADRTTTEGFNPRSTRSIKESRQHNAASIISTEDAISPSSP